jgi:hypothetical protein
MFEDIIGLPLLTESHAAVLRAIWPSVTSQPMRCSRIG